MPKFSERELQNAILARSAAVAFRPTAEEMFLLYSELCEHLPPAYLNAFLPGNRATWRRQKRVPVNHHRIVYLLHTLMFNQGETNLFNLAAWGRLLESKHKRFSHLEDAIM